MRVHPCRLQHCQPTSNSIAEEDTIISAPTASMDSNKPLSTAAIPKPCSDSDTASSGNQSEHENEENTSSEHVDVESEAISSTPIDNDSSSQEPAPENDSTWVKVNSKQHLPKTNSSAECHEHPVKCRT